MKLESAAFPISILVSINIDIFERPARLQRQPVSLDPLVQLNGNICLILRATIEAHIGQHSRFPLCIVNSIGNDEKQGNS